MLVMPVSFLFLSAVLLSWRRRMKRKFETSVLHLCACMNATENVRGINFRLSRVAPEQVGTPSSSLSPTAPPPSSASYSITIEFDDRYNLLHHFAIPSDGTQRPSSNAMKQPYTFSGGVAHPATPTSPPSYRVSANLPPSYSHTNLEFPTNVYHPNEKA
ncbi:hypothetical protein BCR43DRAFT_508731 [Syncephalastrum racemosum]|uniref:Uncharacterized protein n=1 Tax=Syncephalastrum racemosum TaxID=13706 RepID=A0A1X2H1R2_SYNRA|nr:hypothetical protein BCR43DRAFT_508731 [Syncephalastrum racemosum]